VIIRFWADEAAIYAVPGAAFTLWYGRPVGIGVVTSPAGALASPVTRRRPAQPRQCDIAVVLTTAR